MMRPSGVALVVIAAIVPLLGSLAALDAAKPPIPPLVPRPAALAIALVLFAALAATAPAAARAARRDWLTLAFFAPGLASLASSLTGFAPVLGVGLSLAVLGFGAAGLAFARDADAATTRTALRAFLWSALAACTTALVMVAVRAPAALYAYNNGRAVGTFLNPNELAAYTLVGLGLAVPPAVASRGRDRLALVTSVALVVALGATFSRWGALSAACGLAVYALAARLPALAALALAVALAGLGLDAAAGARHHNPRDTEARTVAWRAGLTTFARFPLLGVGPLAFPKTYDALRAPDAPGPQTPVAFDPHSLPIAFAAEGGTVALVTLGTSFTIVLRRLFRDAAGARGLPRSVALGVAAALIALLVDCAINTISLFFPLGLAIVPLAFAVVRTDAR